MANKNEREMAYEAGRRARSIVWPEDATDEQRTPGAHHCPFPEGDPQRPEWLRGLADAIEEDAVAPTVLKEIRDELKVADRASS